MKETLTKGDILIIEQLLITHIHDKGDTSEYSQEEKQKTRELYSKIEKIVLTWDMDELFDIPLVTVEWEGKY